MGILSNKVERSNLEAGDHIYTWRTLFSYAHHGIYVGGDRVVHFTNDLNNSSSFLSISSSSSHAPKTCSVCGHRKNSSSGVVKSCLDCFLGDGSLYRYEYGVSKKTFILAFRGGTWTTAKSGPPEDVIHRATYLLQTGFGDYNLLSNNCEDFAVYCKTELLVSNPLIGGSGQISTAFGMSVYANDYGVRNDVTKVKVEDVAAFIARRRLF